MQSPKEIEQDIIRRVFDESFLNEALLARLLRAYGDACAAAERERAAQMAEEAANILRAAVRTVTPEDLVLAILEAHARPGTQPADLFAIARRALDARAAAERERCALLIETKQPVSTLSGPMLVDDSDPDVHRRLYADAIRVEAPGTR